MSTYRNPSGLPAKLGLQARLFSRFPRLFHWWLAQKLPLSRSVHRSGWR